MAFAICAASGFAIVTAARLGPRRSIAATASVLALTTLAFTAIRQEWLDVVLSAAPVIAGTQWLAPLPSPPPARPRPPPAGVPPPPALGPPPARWRLPPGPPTLR